MPFQSHLKTEKKKRREKREEKRRREERRKEEKRREEKRREEEEKKKERKRIRIKLKNKKWNKKLPWHHGQQNTYMVYQQYKLQIIQSIKEKERKKEKEKKLIYFFCKKIAQNLKKI